MMPHERLTNASRKPHQSLTNAPRLTRSLDLVRRGAFVGHIEPPQPEKSQSRTNVYAVRDISQHFATRIR